LADATVVPAVVQAATLVGTWPMPHPARQFSGAVWDDVILSALDSNSSAVEKRKLIANVGRHPLGLVLPDSDVLRPPCSYVTALPHRRDTHGCCSISVAWITAMCHHSHIHGGLHKQLTHDMRSLFVQSVKLALKDSSSVSKLLLLIPAVDIRTGLFAAYRIAHNLTTSSAAENLTGPSISSVKRFLCSANVLKDGSITWQVGKAANTGYHAWLNASSACLDPNTGFPCRWSRSRSTVPAVWLYPPKSAVGGKFGLQGVEDVDSGTYQGFVPASHPTTMSVLRLGALRQPSAATAGLSAVLPANSLPTPATWVANCLCWWCSEGQH
jgi:hypothetical protein